MVVGGSVVGAAVLGVGGVSMVDCDVAVTLAGVVGVVVAFVVAVTGGFGLDVVVESEIKTLINRSFRESIFFI